MVFRMLKQMLSGEVLEISEVPMSNGIATLRLKAKRDRSSGECYVTLSTSSLGHSEFQHLNLSEFAALVAAVETIDAVLRSEVVSPSGE